MNNLYIIFFISLLITGLSSCSIEQNENVNPQQKETTLEWTPSKEIRKLVETTYFGKKRILEEVNGDLILEGDMILTPTQIKKSNEKGAAHEHLMYRWPNNIVYYTISPNVPNQKRITDAISHWEHTNLHFISRTTQPNYIEFVVGSGCSSSTGMIGGRQKINISNGCSMGNMIHEIGHAIGLYHEHTRTDRDKYVKIHWDNLDTEHYGFKAYLDFETYENRGRDGFDNSYFDFNSIMLYSSTSFAKPGMYSITKLDGTPFEVQRSWLSGGDIDIANKMYPAHSSTFAVDICEKIQDNTNSITICWNPKVTNSTIDKIEIAGLDDKALFSASNVSNTGSYTIKVNNYWKAGLYRVVVTEGNKVVETLYFERTINY